MIKGLGSDIVRIDRVERLLSRFGSVFIQRILTKKEQQQFWALSATRQSAFMAKRFAAKEACVKALGTGFRNGIGFQDIEIVNTSMGKPEITLKGKALEYAAQMGQTTLWLALSDDAPFAQAIVIIEVQKEE